MFLKKIRNLLQRDFRSLELLLYLYKPRWLPGLGDDLLTGVIQAKDNLELARRRRQPIYFFVLAG
jgi:hypothetical protein